VPTSAFILQGTVEDGPVQFPPRMYTLEVLLDIGLLHELTVAVVKGALVSFAEVEGVDMDPHVAFPSELLVAVRVGAIKSSTLVISLLMERPCGLGVEVPSAILEKAIEPNAQVVGFDMPLHRPF